MKVGEKLDDVSGNIKPCLMWCACVGSVCMCVAVVYVCSVSIHELIPTLTGRAAVPSVHHRTYT